MDHIIYFLGFVFLRDAIKPWFPVFRDTQLLLEWALTSSVLILIVLAVRRLFKEKLSARLRYALWGVVLLRLLVPFQVQLPAAAGDALPVLASNLAPEPPASWEERDVPVFPGGEVPIEEAHPYYQAFPPGYLGPGPWSDGCVSLSEDGKTVTPYADIFTRNEVIQSIWWVGTLGMAAALLVSNLRFFIRLEERRKQLEVPDAPIPVYTAEGLPSPCLFGVFRPAVYITSEAAENPDTLRHVLAHELTHHAHFDHLWSLLRCLALALHWYNPLVWLAVVLSKQDGELACDEGAVARLGEAERIPYGRTLVDMVAARSLRPGDLLSCSTAMTGGGKSVKQRVAQIVKKPETVRTALFAVIALVALGLVFTFAGRGAAGRENKMLQGYLDRTTAIHYSPPSYSSQFYSEPISDPDLLAEAKEALSGFRYLEDGDPQPDLRETLHQSRIILTFEGGEMEYSLLWQNGRTYLFPGSIWKQAIDLQEEEGETAQLQGVSGTCISRQGENVISILESLARQQMAYNTGAWDWAELLENQRAAQSRLSAALEDCEWIRFQDSSIPDITDPICLDWAKRLLTVSNMLLIDDMSQTGEDGDNETIVICGKGGQSLSSFLITNQQLRQQLHDIALNQQENLTQAQVDQINKAFQPDVELPDGSWGSSEISCFFTSSYDDPTQIDLEEFLAYCPLAEILEDSEAEEFQAVIAKDGSWDDWEYGLDSPGDLPLPTKRYPREKVSALLQKYAGVSVEKLDWSGCLYLEEYDAFYNFTSDFGPGVFYCEGGNISGDTVQLWSAPDGNGDRCELVLRKNGESWLIQSHHTIYER